MTNANRSALTIEETPGETDEQKYERLRKICWRLNQLRTVYVEFLSSPDHNESFKGEEKLIEEFHAYVIKNHPRLAREINAQACEQFLEHYAYLCPEEPLPEPLTPYKRYELGCDAYRKFPEDTKYLGTEDRERVMAFYHYITMQYPHSLPKFTEQEAEAVIHRRPPPPDPEPESPGAWRRVPFAFRFIGTLTLALGGMIGLASMAGKDESSMLPAAPSLRTNNDDPNVRPMIRSYDKQPYGRRFLVPERPLVMPDAHEMEKMQKQWQQQVLESQQDVQSPNTRAK